MKNQLTLTALALSALSTLNPQLSTAFAQGTAFTYQGRLNTNGDPAGGIYDLRFTIYDSTDLPGVIVAGPLTNSAVGVSNGLFTVLLDFGGSPFSGGAARWLDVAVRSNSAATFSVLSPRQPLTAAPYAITASNLTGTLSASQLSGTVPSAQLSGTYSGALTLNNAANSFTGNGTGLTNVNAVALGGFSVSNFWRLGGNNVVAGQFLGSTNNQALELRANGSRALRLEPNTNGAPNVIGGAPNNFVDTGVIGATIAGGGASNFFGSSFTNRISANFATIGGGIQNTIQTNATEATIGGGSLNAVRILAAYATIGGGLQNTIQSNAYLATIGGGYGNTIQNDAAYGTIGGGYTNTIQTNAYYSTIGGGTQNKISTNTPYGTISGGYFNAIQSNALYSAIGGGIINTIEISASASAIPGGFGNDIGADSFQSVIGGGNGNFIASSSEFSTIGGGNQNQINSNSPRSVIGGGDINFIDTGAPNATIGGGVSNSIAASAYSATIGGGSRNTIAAASLGCTIGGGLNNYLSGFEATISGGVGNTNLAQWASIVGGIGGTIESGAETAILGGYQNRIQSGAYRSVIAGGEGNTVRSNAHHAFISGGADNVAAGTFSFAAGFGARALHSSAFVWTDAATGTFFDSTSSNQFLIRATGGVGIGTGSPAGAIHIVAPTGVPPAGLVSGNNGLLLGLLSTSGYKWIQSYGGPLVLDPVGNNVGIATTNPTALFQVFNAQCDGNNWNNTCDRNLKENFTAVDPRAVLEKVAALPITRWNYKSDTATAHLGPMAQDFQSAFALGADDKHISTVDEGGVALAAIQGLNQKLEQKETEIAELKQRLEALERIIARQTSN